MAGIQVLWLIFRLSRVWFIIFACHGLLDSYEKFALQNLYAGYGRIVFFKKCLEM